MQISECSAVITGGGSGLGEATARELATHGARVALLDLPSSKGEAVAKELGRAAIYCPTDVSDGAQVEAAIERAVGELGGIHIAVNCAGIGTAGRTISRDGPHDLADFERPIRVNLIGTFNVVRFAVAPVLATAVARKLISENWILSLEPNLVQTLSVVIFVALLGNVALAALDTAERLRDNPPEIPVLFREEGSLPEFIAGLRRLVRRDEEESDSL